MKHTEWYVKNVLDKSDVWLQQNLLIETILGSHAYGCATKDSDFDIYCVVMPRREHLWPQEYGYVLNFDEVPSFRRKQLKGPEERQIINKREVEIEWISLVEFFILAGLKGSPNLLEVLFTRKNLVTACSKVGWALRDKRKMFLSHKTFQSFNHYACRQMQKIRSRKPVSVDRRQVIEKHGYDIKMGYHVLRLLDEMNQMLVNDDIDLMRNNAECLLMKTGKWGDFDRFERVFQDRLDHVDEIARKTALPPEPKISSLHKLLSELIESYYGSKDKAKKDIEYISTEDVMNKLSTLIEIDNNVKELLKRI